MDYKTVTFLEIVEDNDGDYDFYPLEECGSKANAIAVAWRRHREFVESDNGEDFRDEECLNVHEDDFIESISGHGMVVTGNDDMTCRRIYRLITIGVNTVLHTA